MWQPSGPSRPPAQARAAASREFELPTNLSGAALELIFGSSAQLVVDITTKKAARGA